METIKMRLQYNNNKGISFIELLIVLAIMSVVTSAIFTAFNSQHKVHVIQDEVVEMQQNVRVGIDMITEDVMMAGYKMGATIQYTDLETPPAPTPVVSITNSSTGTDQLVIYYVVNSSANLPDLTTSTPNNQSSTSAITTVVEELSDITYNPWLNYPTPFRVIITDGERCDLILINNVINNGVGTDDRLNHPSYGGVNNNRLIHSYPAGSKIIFLPESSMVTYQINSNTLQRQSGLTGGTFDTVADDIENMQCAYILADGTEIADGSITTAQYEDVRAVRVTLVSRTRSLDSSWTSEGQPGFEDFAAVATSDGYRRRSLTAVVKIRNLGLEG
ncbi:MAG: PilW family protein [bacterium]